MNVRKTHRVTLEEARSVLSAKTEVLIIGAGWDGLVTVDPSVRELQGVRVVILTTPEAFRLYNELKSEGISVALIAHSTC